jgi:hypothetical protein
VVRSVNVGVYALRTVIDIPEYVRRCTALRVHLCQCLKLTTVYQTVDPLVHQLNAEGSDRVDESFNLYLWGAIAECW